MSVLSTFPALFGHRHKRESTVRRNGFMNVPAASIAMKRDDESHRLRNLERSNLNILRTNRSPKNDLATLVNNWNCRPHMVSKDAPKSFAEFALRMQEGFTSDIRYFQDFAAKASVLRSTEKVVSRQ